MPLADGVDQMAEAGAEPVELADHQRVPGSQRSEACIQPRPVAGKLLKDGSQEP